MEHRITLPLKEEDIKNLKAGDSVFLTGVMYTGRDQAHKRIFNMIQNGEELPFDLKDQTIYYVGPCPKPVGMAIGSCGPTTSYRVDVFTPTMLENGIKGMIGKGKRGDEVIESMVKNGAVYFSATGGAAALYASCVKKCDLIAFEDLLSEAVYRLEVEDFPVIVAIDSFGNSLYNKGE